MKKYLLPILFIFTLLSCGNEKKSMISPLKQGAWRGILTLDDSTGLILPFNFDLSFQNDSTLIVIHNAEEKIVVNEISFLLGDEQKKNDSIIIQMPVFDSEFRCKILGDSLLVGSWINHSRKGKNIIPFTAVYGATNRFDCPEYDTNFRFEGKWECVFGPTDPDSSTAIGVFKQSGHKATGTFLTETGDYRYLEGCVFGKYMLLSCFDGSHAFVFHAEIMEDSTIWGEFYSGIHFHQTWLAKKNETFHLRNPDSLTFIKPGFGKIKFSFPSIDNKMVSLSDEKYKNKVVILQIMGSWCPNCMDETMFLTKLHKKFNPQGLEVISLAFEKSDEFETAKSHVMRLKKKYNSEYDFLITGIKPNGSEKTGDQRFIYDALPMLNHIMSFPTTIFIDKQGIVRKIHTGYSGPATGEVYTRFEKEINSFVETLVKEPI
jgi:thiol-disulfide isomerase/thioredoxin